MINKRHASERGGGDHGWLDTRHTFSFGDYNDPRHMGFRALRVINEDRVQPGQGFGTHGHRDMEIISYVLEGKLEHQDSLGHGEVLSPGEFQRISAGTGIRHSEFNPSQTEPVHEPSYEQKRFPETERQGRLRVVASPTGREGSLTIHQNADVFLCSLAAGEEVTLALRPNRHAWLQVLRGAVQLNGVALTTSAGAAVSEEEVLVVKGTQPAEIMLFDLP